MKASIRPTASVAIRLLSTVDGVGENRLLASGGGVLGGTAARPLVLACWDRGLLPQKAALILCGTVAQA